MRRFGVFVVWVFSGALASGCAIPQRQHVLIDRYVAARCLPPSSSSTTLPAVREWDTRVTPDEGRELRIIGHQSVSGIVVAHDERTGQEYVVANAGDYIYPSDLRTSSDDSRIFVKADGLAGGLWQETWLYEYDLVNLRQIAKVRVDPTVLPPECPGGPANR